MNRIQKKKKKESLEIERVLNCLTECGQKRGRLGNPRSHFQNSVFVIRMVAGIIHSHTCPDQKN